MKVSHAGVLIGTMSWIVQTGWATQFAQQSIRVSVEDDRRILNAVDEVGTKQTLATEAAKTMLSYFPYWDWNANAKNPIAELRIDLTDIGTPGPLSGFEVTINCRSVPLAHGFWRTQLFHSTPAVAPNKKSWTAPVLTALEKLLGANAVAVRESLKRIPVSQDVEFPEGNGPWKDKDVLAVLGLKWPDGSTALDPVTFQINAEDPDPPGAIFPIYSFSIGKSQKFRQSYDAVVVRFTCVNARPVERFDKAFTGLKVHTVFWRDQGGTGCAATAP